MTLILHGNMCQAAALEEDLRKQGSLAQQANLGKAVLAKKVLLMEEKAAKSAKFCQEAQSRLADTWWAI